MRRGPRVPKVGGGDRLANLEAAILCNHTKAAPANWARPQALRKREEGASADEQVGSERQAIARRRPTSTPRRRPRKEAAADKQRPSGCASATRSAWARPVAASSGPRPGASARPLGRIQAQPPRRQGPRLEPGHQPQVVHRPRVYHGWGEEVDYDVLEKYYPTTLRRKFAWVRVGTTQTAMK